MFHSRIPAPRRPTASGSSAVERFRERGALRQLDPDLSGDLDQSKLAGFEAARRFFASLYRGVDPARETLFVAYLDRGASCVHFSRHDGDVREVAWPLRAILLEAARCDAAGLIVAHNHPSGECRPSASDRSATHRLATAAEAMDVTLVDHLLFAREECVSFRRLGLL